MATVIDTLGQSPQNMEGDKPAKPRHPEKQNRPDSPVLRKPDWIRVKAPGSAVYNETRQIMRDNNLFTVCEEAACPNVGECWSKRHAFALHSAGTASARRATAAQRSWTSMCACI